MPPPQTAGNIADNIQINSVGLTKNLIRAIKAQSDDLPPLDAFPKSHIVTFEYYLGVIHFLDENYAEVCEIILFAFDIRG